MAFKLQSRVFSNTIFTVVPLALLVWDILIRMDDEVRYNIGLKCSTSSYITSSGFLRMEASQLYEQQSS